MFPVNKDGMGLNNSVTSAKDKYKSLIHASSKLIGAFKGKWYLSTAYHVQVVKWERQDGKKY